MSPDYFVTDVINRSHYAQDGLGPIGPPMLN